MSRRYRSPDRLGSVSGLISLGLVLSLVGGSLLMGDVTLGSVSLRQSGFFGGATLLSGFLFVLAGVLTALRVYREKRQRRP